MDELCGIHKLPQMAEPKNQLKFADRVKIINLLCAEVHEANKKWWIDISKVPFFDSPPPSVDRKDLIQLGNEFYFRANRNVGEMLCLVHSEISEALEGHRKDLMDDKLPHRKQFEVELADAIIRIFDIAAGLGLDLGGAYVEKMAYNTQREDHKLENRVKDGGKKY